MLARLGDRSLFPRLRARAYLAHAGISPPSVRVTEAVERLLTDYSERGLAAFLSWQEQRNRLRAKLADLIAARPEDVALVLSTTDGIRDVALCLPWHAGDRVVVFEGEFPANVTPWQRAAEAFGLEIVMLPQPAGGDLGRIEAELRRGVRLVAISLVQFASGRRMPVEALSALCRAHGAEVLVDAVQALGVVPVDVGSLGVDYLACGSHKWLMGIEGAGMLWVHPDRIGGLRPTVAGWLSHEDPVAFLVEGGGRLRYDRPVRRRVDFVEGGNLSATSFAGLEASVDLISSIGVPAIAAHVGAYVDALERALLDLGFSSLRSRDAAERSGILSVIPPAPADVVTLARLLGDRGVACSTPDGLLRFAPHWPNDLAEVPFVIDAAAECLAASR